MTTSAARTAATTRAAERVPASSDHGPLLAIIARKRRYARSVATTRVTAALRRA